MTSPIQRFPFGLLELIGAKNNGQNPPFLASEMRASIESLQLFGLGNLQNLAATAAIAVCAAVQLTVPASTWYLLYAASIHIVKTATMGDGAFSLRLNPAGASASVALASEYIVTGTSCNDWAVVGWTAPYPMLLAPGTVISAVADLVSTDPTVTTVLRARVGVLS